MKPVAYFDYWQLCNGAWMHSSLEPDKTIKQSWYRKFTNSTTEVWRYVTADGLDNPGTRETRVAFDDLPAELRLAVTLVG